MYHLVIAVYLTLNLFLVYFSDCGLFYISFIDRTLCSHTASFE